MNIDNPKIWSLTDGSQGMISQTKGLANELSVNIKEIKTEIIFPWNKLQPGILPIFNWIFKNKLPIDEIPDLVISCGRKSVYLSIYLKKKYPNIINIHIQNPKISSKNFSYVIAPNHDGIYGDNIINSSGAIHHFKQFNNLKNHYEINTKNLITCIIGGENNHYNFSKENTLDLCKRIKILKSHNNEILVLTSRRTNIEIKHILKKELSTMCTLWLGEGKNPYEFAIYNSSYFIITSDSTSMISEASISGKPIYVYQLPMKRKSKRFIRFHEEFKKMNITRDFNTLDKLENWTYTKLEESKRIAGIIKKRIIERKNES